MNELIQYLLDKIASTNLNNSRANTGAVILKLVPELDTKIKPLLAMVIQIMQGRFSKATSADPVGMAKLTNLSMAIGTSVADQLGQPDLKWQHKLRLGDLFLEAFLMAGYITMYRDGDKPRSPYVIAVLDDWSKVSEMPEAMARGLLVGSTEDIIAPVSSLVQADNRSLIKRWESEDTQYFKDSLLDEAFVKTADVLQATRWAINSPVLEVLLENQALFIQEEQPVPMEGSPTEVENAYKALKKKDTPENREAYQAAAETWGKKKLALSINSKNTEYSLTLNKARMLDDMDEFSQYVSFDYRGRIYYSEPFINFQGSDMARSLLRFKKPKRVTTEGEKWLAIHAANSFNASYTIDELREIDWFTSDYVSYLENLGMDSISVDKMSLLDREMWTWKNLAMILETANNKKLHMKCEKPVAFLAASFELKKMIEAKTQDVPFYSTLPIPIDGQCNGWQHLAAMSKDEQAGALVGLSPLEIPRDFYIATALELYHLTPDGDLKDLLKTMPMKDIRKGIAKRGSMVRAYSAGQNRIAENMYYDCCAEGYDDTYGIDMMSCTALSKTLIKAIDNVCAGPMKTMKYLQELAAYEIGTRLVYDIRTDEPADHKAVKRLKEAKNLTVRAINKNNRRVGPLTISESRLLTKLDRISRRLNNFEQRLHKGNGAEVMCWITPSGFPVWYVDDYQFSESCKGTINTPQKAYRVDHRVNIDSKKPDPISFGKGVAPNFVHSMDAAHLCLVVNAMDQDFGAVHDSFSVHASDVPALLNVTKQTFMDMYGDKDMFQFMRDRLLETEEGFDVEPPVYGVLDVNNINQSEYFFS